MPNRQALLLGSGTYGYYYKDSGIFECTHGAWDSKLTFLDDKKCKLDAIDRDMTYQRIEKIPEEHIR